MPIIHEFHRNSQEKIIIQFQEYRGKEYVDIRIHYEKSLGCGTEWLPTPKGIKIKPDLLPELMKGLNKTLKQLEQVKIQPEGSQESISGRS